MLEKHTVITPIAVNDLENAIVFYGEVLGLKQISMQYPGAQFESNGGIIGIHQSPLAGSSLATCAWWMVDDVEGMVKTLKSKGIQFEKNYDLPHVSRKGGVYLLSDTQRAAWFKDPDGNVLGFGNF